jgi:hypothetical protein
VQVSEGPGRVGRGIEGRGGSDRGGLPPVVVASDAQESWGRGVGAILNGFAGDAGPGLLARARRIAEETCWADVWFDV